jgi:hypothetical protein
MGGLAVQKLLSLGKGEAAVVVDSAPPAGIFSLHWRFLRSNLSDKSYLGAFNPTSLQVRGL